MRVREPFDLPEQVAKDRDRAKRLEWITLAYMLSVIGLLALVMGQSQAMKTAWVEDILTLVPPIAFLIACRIEDKAPNARFPYGYHRATSIAFLVASVALFAVGALLLLDSSMHLIKQEKVTLRDTEILGMRVWQGWLMIGALVYAIVPAVFLGRAKLPLAHGIHDKVLYADADMNKADWTSGAAAILGILGLGMGLWWADGLAGALISLSILHDGWKNLSQVIRDLSDEAPTPVGTDDPEPLPKRLRDALLAKEWVVDAAVRLREEGRVLTGEAFIVPREDTDLVGRLETAASELKGLDWRVYDLSLVPVRRLQEAEPQRSAGE